LPMRFFAAVFVFVLVIEIQQFGLATTEDSVQPAAGCTLPYSAQWAGQSVSEVMLIPGYSQQEWIWFTNVGCNTWAFQYRAHLGTWNPEPGQDQYTVMGGNGQGCNNTAGWLSCNRIDQTQTSVPPGANASFQFNLQAPYNTVGTRRLYIRPVIDGVTWMEDYGVWWQIDSAQTNTYPGCVNYGGAVSYPDANGWHPTFVNWSECTQAYQTYDNHASNVLKVGGQNLGGCVEHNPFFSQIIGGSLIYHSPSRNWGPFYPSGANNWHGCTYQYWGGWDFWNPPPMVTRQLGEGFLSVTIRADWSCWPVDECSPPSLLRQRDYYFP